ncbi:tail fiber domain-containing protein [Aquirufa sp. TARAVU-A1A]
MKSNLFICLILIFACNSAVKAQSSVRKTLNYQAVILDPKPVEIPGKSLVNQPLFKAQVCLKFALLNGQSGVTDYEETQQVTTDEYGLVSVSIGNGISTGQGTFKSFDSIKWDAAIKSLKVSVSYDACTNYKAVSTQSLNYSPYALFAESTEYANVRGVPTKVSQFQNDAQFLAPKDLDPLNTALAKTNQAIESNKIIAENNFVVSTKKIDTLKNNITTLGSQLTEQSSRIVDVHSIANNAQQVADNALNTANNANNQISNIQYLLTTQNANSEQISNKSISVAADATSDIRYPSVKAVKDYVDVQITSGVAGVTTPDATTTSPGKIQLAGDLGGTATSPTVPGLASKAPLNSPALTGIPTAPTATAGDNSTQIATTSFVSTAVTTAVTSGATPDATTTLFGKIQLAGDLAGTASNPTVPGLAAKAPLNSPALTGTPTAPTVAAGDNSTKIATTSFVSTAVTTAVTSGATPDATITSTGKIQLAGDLGGTATSPTVPGLAAKAPLNSPSLTGTPTAPTVAAGDNSTKIATTSFVSTAVTTAVTSGATPDATTTSTGKIQLAGDLGGTATSPTVPGLFAKAPLNSPALTGTPTAPTATAGDNSTQIATTSFVSTAITSGATPDASTTSTGKIQLAGDLGGTATSPTVPGLSAKAPLNSPALTGTPTAPTATAGDNSTQIATTSFVSTAITSGATPDASTTSTGKIQLAGDLGGTATSPTVPGLSAKAPLNSPALTGTPTAPTATAGNNSTQIATTSFVAASLTTAIVPASSSVSGIVNNTANQELGGVDKMINGVNIGRGGSSVATNLAFGTSALSLNTTGGLNQAIGFQTLRNNTTGIHNVASGYQTLSSNTIGLKNSAYGVQSLFFNTQGNFNVATGIQSLYNNTVGNNNVALGALALYYNTSGSGNIGIGFQAGYLSTATTGSNNIYIGSLALPSATVNNEIVIGNNSVGRGQNTVAIGNSSTTNNYFYGAIEATAFNVTSDQRLKTNITPLTNANQLINQLLPVSYDKKINLTDSNYSVHDEFGFIAQQVQKVLPNVVSQSEGKDGLMSINYTSLIPLLTKALQEQGQNNQKLKQQISQQADRIQALEKSLEKLLAK